MTEQRTSPILAWVAAATTIVVWAAAFPAIHLALKEVQPLPLSSARYAVAALMAAAWFSWRRPDAMKIKDIAICAACALCSAVGYSVLLNFGQQTVSPGAAGFLVKTESVWMALLAVVFLRERFNGWAWLGTFAALAGVAVIGSAQPGGLAFGAGTPLVLAAAFCSASGFVLQRPLFKRYGAVHVAATIFIAAALFLSPWLPTAAAQVWAASATTQAWVVFLSLFPTVLGLVCWTYALGHFGAARAGNLLYLVAPLSLVLTWLLTTELPSIETILGGTLVLAGVLLVSALGGRSPKPASAQAAPPAGAAVAQDRQP